MKSVSRSRPTVCHLAATGLFAAGYLMLPCLAYGRGPVIGEVIGCTHAVSQLAPGLTIHSDLLRSGSCCGTAVNDISLFGTADPAATRLVLVNGLPAQWLPQEGRWQYGDASGGVEAIVESGSMWKYIDDGSDQEEAWRDPDFNDGSGASGKAQLGCGDNDETTVVRYGLGSGYKHMTMYFRHVFEASDISFYEAIRLRLLLDDGAVVYLNGVEVLRSNMPAGTVKYTTPASGSLSGANENTFPEPDVPLGLVHSGFNILAVEIHQASGSSGDSCILSW